jgi:hypothetical protein
MSKEPKRLTELRNFWTSHGGVFLGVVGNEKHCSGYHLGKDRIFSDCACKPKGPCVKGLGADDLSIKHPRDRDFLTNAASAIDLGALNGNLKNLRVFSRWLVARCMADPAVRHDVREVIYTVDGKVVQRYDAIDNKIRTGKGQGNDSHLTHTHISFMRDSESREKVSLFRPFFEVAWGANVPAEIRAVDPKPMRVAMAIREARHDFGSQIDMEDLAAAMKKAGQDFGQVVNVEDVKKFLKNAAT